MTNIEGNNRQLFVLEGTSEEIEEIIALFESGELSELLGVDVLDAGLFSESQMSEINKLQIQQDAPFVDTTLTRTTGEQEAFAKNLLSICKRQGYSWVKLSQVIKIVQYGYHATDEALATAFRELLFPDDLAVVTKSDSHDEDSVDAYFDQDFLEKITADIINFYKRI
ncbi:hypothetical protein QT979_17365 [Microcoleus sp. w2-18bC1]|uniref:hypothetical protein n=1 Tax=unclassified Microcoleus TaxID=2642155 RepID=UPI002FCFF07E